MKRARMIRRAADRRRVAHLDLHSKPAPESEPGASTSSPKGDQ
jgi:hypothetical protein